VQNTTTQATLLQTNLVDSLSIVKPKIIPGLDRDFCLVCRKWIPSQSIMDAIKRDLDDCVSVGASGKKRRDALLEEKLSEEGILKRHGGCLTQQRD